MECSTNTLKRKYSIITLILTLTVSTVFSQSTYLQRGPFYVNEDFIDSIIKNEISKISSKYLIYQNINDGELTSITSFLLFKTKNGTSCWVITNDSILSKINLKSDSIFSYKNYLKTGAQRSEVFNGFIPPVLCGINTENVVYNDCKVNFYFEYGSNVSSFSPNQKLLKYRQEWLNMIKRELCKAELLCTKGVTP